MALVASRSYVKQTEYRDKVFAITTPLFSSQLEMLCERGFPLLKRINSILGLFRDAGIMSKLRHDFVYNSTILIAVKELVKALGKNGDLNVDTLNILDEISDDEEDGESESGPIPLRPEHLMGAITLLLLGLGISFVIFSMEHLTNKKFFKDLRDRIDKFEEKLKLKFKKTFLRFFEKITCNFDFSKLRKYFRSLKLKLQKNLTGKKKRKNEIKLLRRRVRRFAYRPIRFTPKGRRFPLISSKKII